MAVHETLSENPTHLVDTPYTPVGGGFRNSVEIVNNLAVDLESTGISSFEFQDFFNNFLESNDIEDSEIIAYKVEDNTINVYLSNGLNIKVGPNDFFDSKVQNILGGEGLPEIENRVENINAAIESIYDANDGYLWDGEINDEDVVENDNFGEGLKGKTLSQLRELLEIENVKLYQVYSITRESDKKEELLMLELKFFAGIGDKYEGGSGYFALSTLEIRDKVSRLIVHMSNREVFDFIEQVNTSIEANTKKSDMVNQVNLKLINQLYTQVFDRLLSENASNRDFIDFAKVVTGRGDLISERNGNYNYDDLEIDTDFKSIELANKAMIHVMYREDGILENISTDAANIFVEDEELDGRSPQDAMSYAIQGLEEFAGYNDKTPSELITELGFGDLLGISRQYRDLDFQEKVNLGGLIRIVNAAKDISRQDLEEDPTILHSQLISLVSESFEDLNVSLSDNFNANWLDWNGTSASDLGLEGDLAEIFNLYQDINGNWGAFHFSDTSIDSYTPTLRGTLILGLGIVSAGICMGMLVAGSPIIAIVAAGAAAGAATGFISQILGRQGYDTNSEAIWDTLAVMGTDAIIGAAFFLGSVKFFQKFFNIDILAEKLLSRVNITDMIAFGGAETLANAMITAPLISTYVKTFFPENHFDTDIRALTEQLEALALQEN